MSLTQYTVTCTSPAGSSNTKSTYVQVVASTPYASSRLIVILVSSNTTNTHYLIDIATGAAGSEVVKVANISIMNDFERLCGFPLTIDVDITAGTRIAIRVQSATVNVTQTLSFYLDGRAIGTLADPVTYGANTATSKATTVTPNATTNTKGSYVQLTASTSQRIDALVVTMVRDGGITATYTEWLVDIATGGAGSETIVIPDIFTAWGNGGGGYHRPALIKFPASIPAGTRLAARCSSSVASGAALSISVIGMQEPTVSGGSSETSQIYA